MSRNKGWKTFGIVTLVILASIVIFFSVVAIVARCNDVAFVEQLKQVFGIVEEIVDNAGGTGESGAEVAQALRMLM